MLDLSKDFYFFGVKLAIIRNKGSWNFLHVVVCLLVIRAFNV